MLFFLAFIEIFGVQPQKWFQLSPKNEVIQQPIRTNKWLYALSVYCFRYFIKQFTALVRMLTRSQEMSGSNSGLGLNVRSVSNSLLNKNLGLIKENSQRITVVTW